MGFDDEDFYKTKKLLNKTFYNGKDRSNSQLYKQAGNSICVPVLEKIFKNLLPILEWLNDKISEIWNWKAKDCGRK